MLGIGIITFERLGGCAASIALVQQNTNEPFKLVVADDGSTDGTRDYCQKIGVDVVGRVNRGVAFNVNRALWALRDCDPIILIDSDIWPCQKSWEYPWIEAAKLWGHVNLGFTAICGEGTAEDPFLCEDFGSGCVATSKYAFEAVGYQDPRFYEFNYSIAHAEWTFRYERYFGWKRATPNSTPPCLMSGVKLINLGTFNTPDIVKQSCDKMALINQSEPVYRHPWRDEKERNDFLNSF